MFSAKTATANAAPSSVVQRLKDRMDDAKRMGFSVRMEVLNDEQASWCVVGESKFIILDLSHPAREQLLQLNEILDSLVLQNDDESPLAASNHAA